jgi:hypothetical protein
MDERAKKRQKELNLPILLCTSKYSPSTKGAVELDPRLGIGLLGTFSHQSGAQVERSTALYRGERAYNYRYSREEERNVCVWPTKVWALPPLLVLGYNSKTAWLGYL